MIDSLSDRHPEIPHPERGIKRAEVTKLSRTTSELVETKTQTDYEVQQYLASTAAVQTSLEEDIAKQPSQVPQLNPASHIRVKQCHFEEAIFETGVWDWDYPALAEHIVDDVEFDIYLDDYASAIEDGGDPSHCLIQLFNLILDLSLRYVSESYEPAIKMKIVSQALPVHPTQSTHPVYFAVVRRDNRSEMSHGWADGLFLLDVQIDSRNASASLIQTSFASPAASSSAPYTSGTAKTASGHEPHGPERSDNSQCADSMESQRDKCAKRPLSEEDRPIGTEPRRKRQRIGRQRTPAKATPESLSKPGTHHPLNAPTGIMAACALEMFSALGNRRHLLAISVSGLLGRFWYFDRAGTVSTEEISINDTRFVATVLRMSFATPYDLGIEHSFEAPLEKLPDTECDRNARQVQVWPHFNDVKDYQVVFKGHTFILDGLLHSSRYLYGRGTAVYVAHPYLQTSSDLDLSNNSDARPTPSTVVLKLSWIPVSRFKEGELLKLANKAGVEGIPVLWTTCTLRRLSHGARGRLADSSQYEDRELWVQVMSPVCIPLHQVVNVSEFKQAFISLVKTHRQLYENASILHRDISLNNLMVNSSDHSQGVLVDLDMAQLVDTRQRPNSPYSVSRGAALAACGTGAFRALDLLRGASPPQPLYRHDLESFFYVLVWLVTQHENGRPVVPPYMDVSGWCLGSDSDWTSAYDAKKGFLADTVIQSLHCKHELARTWLPRLRQMFYSGYAALDMVREPLPSVAGALRDSRIVSHTAAKNVSVRSRAAASFDLETLGGHVTYDKFIEILTGS